MGSLEDNHDSGDTSAGTMQEKQQIADKELDVLIDRFAKESLSTQSQPPARKSAYTIPTLRHSQRDSDGKPGVAAEGVARQGSCPQATATSPIQSRPGAPEGTQSSFVPRFSPAQWQPRRTPKPHSSGWKGSRRGSAARSPGMKVRSSVGQEAAPAVPYDLQPVGSTAASSNGQDDSQQPLVADTRPIILFDLNGTLTKHTAARRSSGVNLVRPGIRHLRQIQEHYRLGLFSSATDWTVEEVLPMLESAAGHGARVFSDKRLILHRGHTEDAPREHKESGGKQWDTVKPLSKFFARMHRICLVDDDEFKACVGERDNMILVPRWDSDDANDRVLEFLVDGILRLLDGADEATDLREYSLAISDSVFAAHQQASRQSPDLTHVGSSESARVAPATNGPAMRDSKHLRRAYELSSV